MGKADLQKAAICGDKNLSLLRASVQDSEESSHSSESSPAYCEFAQFCGGPPVLSRT